MSENSIIDRLNVAIYLNDGSSFKGAFNALENKFDFADEKFSHVTNNLKIRSIENDSVVFAYTFESDYLPRVFNLKVNEPITINDYLGYTAIRIEIKLGGKQ